MSNKSFLLEKIIEIFVEKKNAKWIIHYFYYYVLLICTFKVIKNIGKKTMAYSHHFRLYQQNSCQKVTFYLINQLHTNMTPYYIPNSYILI